MNQDIKFLKELQNELKTQDHDSQAAPRFWSVGDYKWIRTSEDDAERYSVYIPEDGGSYELESYLKDIKENKELSSEALEAMEDIECEVSALDWIHEYVDSGANLIPETEVHYICQDTMFLTKAEAKQHIKQNHYHYTKKVHTYAMTAWRAPKVERLLKILETFDWDSIKENQYIL
ncbi:hypothetical protein MOF52_12270 [Bacillus inaquosorum]|uniref:hypothetical protein n=1 Tax=Bacillus inaquosorum TaxID=483913 RepID=UPI00227F6DB0|nr:hypothetical protein [Bacillus inaquosorum]MCY9408787.1 hypothetical protein [Bacillus inaquosorum]MCY9417479.1 hypothetical protein [Bacillus inaquosorum]